jgi:phosphoglycolate phosphatase
MAIDAVLFDLDGTLIDSLPGIQFSVNEALGCEDLMRHSQDLRPLIGPPIRQIFGKLLPAADEPQLVRLEGAFRSSYDSVGWRKTALHANAAPMLEKLGRAGLKLFVATNKPSLATGRILRELEIMQHFEEVLSPDSRTPPFTSKSEMLVTLVNRHCLRAERCLYVGDTEEDRLAGLQAGLPVVLVRHGNGSTSLDPVLTNLADLLGVCKIKRLHD